MTRANWTKLIWFEYKRTVGKNARPPSLTAVEMGSGEMFNFPDGDVILRTTSGTKSRDFRVHKWLLSYTSSVFKDMFTIPQPPESAVSSDVDIITITDSPQALELVLQFVYPSPTLPAVDDFTVLSEALVVADKYDIEAARVRLRTLFAELVKTEPLRAYAVACRFGLTDEMKIASSHTTSLHLPDYAELPDEFKLIPATDYHRLILLHSKYRREVRAIASRVHLPTPKQGWFSESPRTADVVRRAGVAEEHFRDNIKEGIRLSQESLFLSLKAERSISDFSDDIIQSHVSSILSQASQLNLTI